MLRELTARRLVVAGTDADLAAVLVRLLRRERLDVEVAYLPRGRSAAARAWGLPRDAEALALDGAAAPVPLVRDDSGGVLVGRAEARLRGEVYCDETLVLRGAGRVVVEAGPRGVGVRASRTGRAPDGRTRAVPPRAPAGRGSAVGRAVQLGGGAVHARAGRGAAPARRHPVGVVPPHGRLAAGAPGSLTPRGESPFSRRRVFSMKTASPR